MAVLPFFKTRPCSIQQRLPKVTFLAMLADGSRTQQFFLKIPDDKWRISSFDPSTRKVCVEITTTHGAINTVSVVLNHLSPTSVEEADTTNTNKTETSNILNAPVTSPELLALNNSVNQAASSLLNYRPRSLPAF